MKDENYVIKNHKNKINLWEDIRKKWEKDLNLVSWCSKRLERGWRVLEWETLYFCCSHLRGKKRMCKFSLNMETKIPIKLNIFDIEDFLGIEDFLESLLDPTFTHLC